MKKFILPLRICQEKFGKSCDTGVNILSARISIVAEEVERINQQRAGFRSKNVKNSLPNNKERNDVNC